MAGVELVRDLCEEATCPVCLDYFKDPVMIPECGHNLCRVCLDRYCGSAAEGTCPQCRRTFRLGNVGPNRQLANMVEMVRKLSLRGAEGRERVCEQHQKPQHLFCKEDKTLICVTCERKDHRGHETLLVEEAAEEYKNQIRNRLEALREEKEKILARQGDTEREGQDLLEEIKAEKEKTVMVFRQLHQFLDEQENYLLVCMEDIAIEIEREREKHLKKLAGELKSLQSIIQEVEKKLQQPATDLLQDIEKFMDGCQQAQPSENFAVILSTMFKWRILEFCDFSFFLEGVMEQFQDTFAFRLPHQKANLHLDPETAHPRLLVSPDCKSVRWTEMRQDVPDNPERFSEYCFILGREEFIAGKHFWEVTVGNDEENWSVGVARKTVERKGDHTWGVEGGLWCMGKWVDAYRMSDTNTALTLGEELKKIRVVLNCKDGQVSFYDAERGALISEFPTGSFTTETLCPFFYTTKSQLSITS